MASLRPSRGVIISFGGTRDVVEVDACLDESHQLNNTLTDHPVEDGFNITDHSRPEPDTVTLRCFISNTPLSQEQQTRTIREGAATFETTAHEGVRLHDVNSRAKTAFDKLLKMRNEGQLIKVATTLKTYESNSDGGMAIQSLQITRTAKNYDGLEFQITLKQIRVVRNRSTSDKTKKDKRTGKKKNEGSKTTTRATEDTKAFRIAESASQSDNPVISGLGNLFLNQ